MSFDNLMFAERKNQKMVLRVLSKKTDIPVSVLSGIEHGRVIPTAKQKAAIYEALGIEPGGWEIVISRVYCFSLVMENGKAMCYHEKGDTYCQSATCPIKAENLRPFTIRYSDANLTL